MYAWCWDADTYGPNRTFYNKVFEVEVSTMPFNHPTVGQIGHSYLTFLRAHYTSQSGFGEGQCGIYDSRQRAQGTLDRQRVPDPSGRNQIIDTEWAFTDN